MGPTGPTGRVRVDAAAGRAGPVRASAVAGPGPRLTRAAGQTETSGIGLPVRVRAEIAAEDANAQPGQVHLPALTVVVALPLIGQIMVA